MRLLTCEEACTALEQGQIIVFPTETFFGIGCDAMQPDAVGRVFSLKKRALSMPLPVVIAQKSDLDKLVSHVSVEAAALMEAFWPGPLSIVLPARAEVPDLLTANAGRIAVRFSPHPAIARLRERCGCVLVASSANLSGEPPAERLEDLSPSVVAGVAGVYVEGPLPAGTLPSTVVDILPDREGGLVRILRAGAVTEEALCAAGFRAVSALPEDHI